MKLQILQENLNKGLLIVSRSIANKATLPILGNVLLKTDQNRLLLSATNLETGLSLWLGAKIEKEGELTLPAKIFSELVASLPPGKIEISVKDNSLTLSTVSHQATINGISAAEFPKLPNYEREKLFSLPSEKLAKAIEQVAFAAATDEGRPVLTGVLFKLTGKQLELVATDGYRLSLKKLDLETPLKEMVALILPAKTLQEVARLIGEMNNQTIEMGFTKEQNQIVFVFPELEFFSRVIEGDFPPYEKIIPQGYQTKITLDKEGLVRAVKIVSIFARDSANIIKLKTTEGQVELSANSPQVGENKSRLEAKVAGESLEGAFNYRFLQGFLAAVPGEEITLESNGALAPGVFQGEADDSFLHIIMPVKTQNE